MTCPVCGAGAFRTLVPARVMEEQARLRDAFVYGRTERRVNPSELKDLTDLMHGFPAPLLECERCGLAVRGESEVRTARSYEEDRNDLDWMRHLQPRYIEAFRHKESAYRPLLSPGAEVLEIAPHVGGFLQVAEEWNWNAVGLDVGADVTEFLKAKGFRVRSGVIEEADLRDRSFDAVFVWNCFDQLENPHSLLRAIFRVLKPHGLLVVRVPNVLFYELLLPWVQRDLRSNAVQALAYNNLLTFPYLFGYQEDSLVRLVVRWGFEPVRGFNSELLTTPFPDLTERIENEETAVTRRTGRWSSELTEGSGLLVGPWIEVVFRKVDRVPLHQHLLRRQQIDPHFLERAA